MRLLSAIVLLVASVTHAHAPAPSIVGTWRLVAFTAPDSTGRQRAVWGEHPNGQIIYTADGRMSAQLYDPTRAKLGAIAFARPFLGPQPTYGGMYTYFGRWTLDTKAHTVSHHVEGAMAPDWIGGTLVRGYRFVTPDRLELRVMTDATGRTIENGSVLVWERIGR